MITTDVLGFTFDLNTMLSRYEVTIYYILRSGVFAELPPHPSELPPLVRGTSCISRRRSGKFWGILARAELPLFVASREQGGEALQIPLIWYIEPSYALRKTPFSPPQAPETRFMLWYSLRMSFVKPRLARCMRRNFDPSPCISPDWFAHFYKENASNTIENPQNFPVLRAGSCCF